MKTTRVSRAFRVQLVGMAIALMLLSISVVMSYYWTLKNNKFEMIFSYGGVLGFCVVVTLLCRSMYLQGRIDAFSQFRGIAKTLERELRSEYEAQTEYAALRHERQLRVVDEVEDTTHTTDQQPPDGYGYEVGDHDWGGEGWHL